MKCKSTPDNSWSLILTRPQSAHTVTDFYFKLGEGADKEIKVTQDKTSGGHIGMSGITCYVSC